MTGAQATFKLSEQPREHVVFSQGDTVEHPDLRALYALWTEKRGERRMPARNDFTPRDMKAYLRRIHLYDVVEGGRDFRIRLLGTSMTIGMGQDPTGKLMSAFPDPVWLLLGSKTVEQVLAASIIALNQY